MDASMESGEFEEVEEEIQEVGEQINKDPSYQNQHNPEQNNEQLFMPPIKKKIFDTTQVDRSKPHEQDNKVVRNGIENEENSQITTARRIDDDTSKNAQSQPINGAVSNVNQEED